MNRDETIEYYQMRAGEYDKMYTRDNPGRQKELAELYALSSDTLEGRHIIDLACGTGYWTRIVSEKAVSIVGLDINSGTLSEAKKKRHQCPVNFIQADVFRLPFEDRQFNGLLATYLISHIKRHDLDDLARRVRRVLESGTRAFFCDNNLACELKPRLIWDKDHINSYKVRRLEDGREFQILKNYFEREELLSIFKSWGRIERITFRTFYWSVVLTLQ